MHTATEVTFPRRITDFLKMLAPESQHFPDLLPSEEKEFFAQLAHLGSQAVWKDFVLEHLA
jgi:hypothetical protein